jgi:hypothetical protein
LHAFHAWTFLRKKDGAILNKMPYSLSDDRMVNYALLVMMQGDTIIWRAEKWCLPGDYLHIFQSLSGRFKIK